MTPLFPTSDHYLFNLIVMTSPEAKRLWRRAIKEHFGNTCVYCGKSYEVQHLTIDHVHPRCNGGEDLASNCVCACAKCNQSKGSTNWKDWMRNEFGLRPLREYIIQEHIYGSRRQTPDNATGSV